MQACKHAIICLQKRGDYSMAKSITIRLDEQLHKDVRIQATKEGKTLQSYLIELVKKDLANKK